MALILLENFGISDNSQDYTYANYNVTGATYIGNQYSTPVPAYPDQSYFGFVGGDYYPTQLATRFDGASTRNIYFGLRIFLTEYNDFTIQIGSYGYPAYGTLNLTGSGHITYTPDGLNSPTWTSTNTFGFDQWLYLEFAINTIENTGSISVQLNGEAFDSSGNTQNINPNGNTVFPSVLTFTRTSDANSNNVGFTDLYILDSTTAYYNTFLGNIRIYTLEPVSAVNTQFGTNSINNVEGLLGANLSTTNHNFSNVASTSDTFSYASIPYNYQPSVLALRSCFYKDDSLNHSVTPFIVSEGNIQYGNTYYPGGSPYFNLDIFPIDPASNNQFTINSINNLNAGYFLNV